MRYKPNAPRVTGFPERVVQQFLWLPKKLEGEWRWLEMARWFEKYDTHVHRNRVWTAWTPRYWINIRTLR